MDDDSKLLGLVLGATLSVSLGLFTVALCHYLGVARLMLALSSTEPSCRASYTWMYPAFAKAIYPEMSVEMWAGMLARGYVYRPGPVDRSCFTLGWRTHLGHSGCCRYDLPVGQ